MARKKNKEEAGEKKGQKLSKKKIIILIIIILIVAIVAVAAVFAMKKLKGGKKSGKEVTTAVSAENGTDTTGEGATGEDATAENNTSENKEDSTTAAGSTVNQELFSDYSEPFFNRVTASSTLEGKNSPYSPDNITDLLPETAWAEGIDNVGIGEWIDLSSKSEQYVKGVKILNGYCKNPELYKKNCRVKTLSIYSDDGLVKTVELEDKYGEYQTIEFEQPALTIYLRFSIDDVYDGTTYDDTCISEIEVY